MVCALWTSYSGHLGNWFDFCVMVWFFFSSRRRHTRYWRDWSSDVCSSDLHLDPGEPRFHRQLAERATEQVGHTEDQERDRENEADHEAVLHVDQLSVRRVVER